MILKFRAPRVCIVVPSIYEFIIINGFGRARGREIDLEHTLSIGAKGRTSTMAGKEDGQVARPKPINLAPVDS
jgi:hypothetical protein